MLTERIPSKTRAEREIRVDATILGHLLVDLLARGHQLAGFIVDIDALAPDGIERHRQTHRRFPHFDLRPELLVVRRRPIGRCNEDVRSEFGQVEYAALARGHVVERCTRGHENWRGVGECYALWMRCRRRGRCDGGVRAALVASDVDQTHGVAKMVAKEEGELRPYVVAGSRGGEDIDFVGLGFGSDDWLEWDCDGWGRGHGREEYRDTLTIRGEGGLE